MRKVERSCFTCQMRLNVTSMPLVSEIRDQSSSRMPKPRNTPLFVCIRYELTKPISTSTTSPCARKLVRIVSSTKRFSPNPLAMAKTMASSGTMDSSVE